MQIEDGKFYRTRDGHRIGPARFHHTVREGRIGPVPLSDKLETEVYWWSVGSFSYCHQDNGTYGCAIDPDRDIVAEWVDEPAASDPVALTNERKNQHGDWVSQAELAHALKEVLHSRGSWHALYPHRQEALDMIAVKISRILSGDPNHADHWDDIAGYAYLGKGGHK